MRNSTKTITEELRASSKNRDMTNKYIEVDFLHRNLVLLRLYGYLFYNLLIYNSITISHHGYGCCPSFWIMYTREIYTVILGTLNIACFPCFVENEMWSKHDIYSLLKKRTHLSI